MVEMYAQAQLFRVIFGDGLEGQSLKIDPPKKNAEGILVRACKIRPTWELAYYMGIKDEERDVVDGGVWREYPDRLVKFLNIDPSVGVICIFCDLNGRETELTRFHAEVLESNYALARELKVIKSENFFLHQENIKITSQFQKYLKQLVTVAKPFMTLRGEPGKIAEQLEQSAGEEQQAAFGPQE